MENELYEKLLTQVNLERNQLLHIINYIIPALFKASNQEDKEKVLNLILDQLNNYCENYQLSKVNIFNIKKSIEELLNPKEDSISQYEILSTIMKMNNLDDLEPIVTNEHLVEISKGLSALSENEIKQLEDTFNISFDLYQSL